MTYQTVKDGIVDRMESLGYKQAKQAFDFTEMATEEYGNKFIIGLVEGDNAFEAEGIIGKYDDSQSWAVSIAFKKSARNETINYDEMHRKREEIIRDLDDPANTTSFVDQLRYESFEVEDLESYFVIKINLRARDRITY